MNVCQRSTFPGGFLMCGTTPASLHKHSRSPSTKQFKSVEESSRDAGKVGTEKNTELSSFQTTGVCKFRRHKVQWKRGGTFNNQNFNKLKQTDFTWPVFPTYLWLLLLVVVVREEKLQLATVAGKDREEVGQLLTAESDRSRINGGICLKRRGKKSRIKQPPPPSHAGKEGARKRRTGWVGGRRRWRWVPWGRK